MSSYSADDAPANTLVLTGGFDSASHDACANLLDVAPATELDVLFVTLTGTTRDSLARWRSNATLSLPANLGIVHVDESATSTTSFSEAEEIPAGAHVWTLAAADDLTGLGRAISEFLVAWDANANRTVVCFDSVTTLLLNAETERVFQFLHVLTRRIQGTEATVNYLLNPSAHDDRTVRTIRSLFATVVDRTDGSP